MAGPSSRVPNGATQAICRLRGFALARRADQTDTRGHARPSVTRELTSNSRQGCTTPFAGIWNCARVGAGRWNSAPILRGVLLSLIGLVFAQDCRYVQPARAEPVAGFLTDAENFNDPLCLEWSDGCKTCRRDGRDLANIDCRRSMGACEAHYTVCEKINIIVAKSICNVIVVGNNTCRTAKNYGDFVCTKMPVRLDLPRTQLVQCKHFIQPR
jgi:hypothetical protein